IDMCMRFITIVTPAYILMVITNCLFGVMRGAGDTMGPMWISILGNVVIRVPLAYIIAGMTKSEANPAGDPASIFYSMVIQIAICVVLSIIYYTRGKWRGKAVAGSSVKSK
ncbi:MAG: MATE family efflux transporter, partial [Oscillospiraceae bacterium]|nr:MATE family efflux transporter [Oscillospiraceae bacterium]